MNTTDPMDDQNDLGRLRIDIGDHPSWMTVRTIRFFRRASVEGATQTVLRSAASVASDAGSITGATVAASWAAILPSTSVTRASALFQRASSSAATSRLAGSAASYCRKARSAA